MYLLSVIIPLPFINGSQIGPQRVFLEIYSNWTEIPTVAKGKCDSLSCGQSQEAIAQDVGEPSLLNMVS